ncbi:MAG: retropepsin-like aspartic protease [Proteobacteria bacterium]|nr:retropepsin-like aspartic protease [Pseudomonadota bacterium]
MIRQVSVSDSRRARSFRRGAVGLILSALTVAVAVESSVEVVAVALFKGKAALSVNGKRRLLKIGETSPEGVSLVSASSDVAVIEIEGEHSSLQLDGKIGGAYTRGLAAKTVQLYPDPSGHYFVDGLINGNRFRFLIDTGATAVVINSSMAKRMGLLYDVDGEPTYVSTASGVVAAFKVTFNDIEIRHLALKRVAGVVIDGDFPSEALLGQAFLNRLNMRRDGQVLELQAR